MFQDGTFSLIHCPGCSCSSNNITVPNFVENDGGGGTQTPAAIDNINVSVLTCPSPSEFNVSMTDNEFVYAL